jgi:hypothetical protein
MLLWHRHRRAMPPTFDLFEGALGVTGRVPASAAGGAP